MSSQHRVALVGDYNAAVPAHRAIPLALELASAGHGTKIQPTWFHTSQLNEASLLGYQGIWCVPASPYANMLAALDAIRFARLRSIPFLGTCGGFQHALLEYARHVRSMFAADHTESNPHAVLPLISSLSCSLLEKESELILEEDSILYRCYRQTRIYEGFHCSYGPNPSYEAALFDNDLHVTARDESGQIRGAELRSHPFFVGTLFQPERRALKSELPPLVSGFVEAILNPAT